MGHFAERHVEADGFSIRYLEAGAGSLLCCLHGAGGLRTSEALELLAEEHHVVAFEAPGFGDSLPNERTCSLRELSTTMLTAIEAIGIEKTSLLGQSFGGKLALWMAVDGGGTIEALVLSAPAAIRFEGQQMPSPADLALNLFAHPERQPAREPASPEVAAKQQALAGRLIGPPRDEALEEAMRSLEVPTLVLIGSEDNLIRAELGRIYVELLKNCHFMIVYDAAHAIDGDRPEAFGRVVADFLRDHEGFVVRQTSGLLYR